MSILIEKRSRVLVSDDWGVWSSTTDSSPFVDTDLVEYRQSGSTSIDISDITANIETDSNHKVTGTGYFDDIMETIIAHLDAQYKAERISGDTRARMLVQLIPQMMQQAMSFALAKEATETNVDTAKAGLRAKIVEAEVAEESKDNKLRVLEAGADKAENDAEYVKTQNDELIKSVRYNNRIKALDSLLDMMGTFGAGGLTFDDSQWEFMYNLMATLVSDLNDYKGEWNASTNTPDIANVSTLVQGDFYRVSTAGSTNLDGTDTWAINDIAVYVGDRWVKSDVIIPSSYNVAVVS